MPNATKLLGSHPTEALEGEPVQPSRPFVSHLKVKLCKITKRKGLFHRCALVSHPRDFEDKI